jgi:hypothetical protein
VVRSGSSTTQSFSASARVVLLRKRGASRFVHGAARRSPIPRRILEAHQMNPGGSPNASE